MTDLRTRFRGGDRVPAPDLWEEILRREPSATAHESARSRVVAGIVALALLAATSLVLIRAFHRGKAPGPAVRPSPSQGATSPPSSPSPAVPKTNGNIAFVRTDPKTVKEGQIPKAALYVVEPGGTGIEKLIDLPPYTRVAWSPDGSKIAFGGPGGISVVNADGTGLKSVTVCDPPKCQADASPDWSPDGNSIAFSRFDGFRDSLWVVNADGSGVRPLQSGFVTANALAWSPDGQRIAVVGYFGPGPAVGDGQIYLLDAETGALLGSVYGGQGRVLRSVAWSPDGTQLAFDSTGEDGSPDGAGIYLIDLAGGDAHLLISCEAGAPVCTDSYPAWAPDGRAIVFTHGGGENGSDGVTGDLFVIDLATRDVRPLTNDPGLDCCASWQALP